MKIAIGMSGGVDSSTAALCLKREGYECLGVTMKIWREGAFPAGMAPGNACYGPGEESDIAAAKDVCATLGIPYIVIDCADSYESVVLDYFKAEYRSGRTPNPCIRCNQEIKFGLLPRLVKEQGHSFDAFATGHYARTAFDPAAGCHRLLKGVDPKKDQSYFLYRLSSEQLAAAIFPLGAFRKEDVRRMAREAGLTVHDKEESQDFCSGPYADIIGAGSGEGDIVDTAGKVLGRHQGIWRYTIGQRKGLGIPWSEPLYVLRIDAANNRIVVGTLRETARRTFTVQECVWNAGSSLRRPLRAGVKIRSSAPDAEAVVEPNGDAATVTFAEPQTAITPGQSAVFYEGEYVLGGGIINSVVE